MSSVHWIYWALIATAAQALFDAAAVGLRLTRMSLPLMLGTMWTANRSRAKWLGFVHHMINGVLFTSLYVIGFHLIGQHGWWRGGLIGLGQGLFVLLIGMELLPTVHPRMAREDSGPTAKRQLEPPGFLALNYGPQTPISILVSHVVFGIVIGAFCHGSLE